MKENKFSKTPENMQLACRVWMCWIPERTMMIDDDDDDDDDDIGQSRLFSNINNDSFE
jgi:hypothetical protein